MDDNQSQGHFFITIRTKTEVDFKLRRYFNIFSSELKSSCQVDNGCCDQLYNTFTRGELKEVNIYATVIYYEKISSWQQKFRNLDLQEIVISSLSRN